jgi:CRP-like cAMP-binding protein
LFSHLSKRSLRKIADLTEEVRYMQGASVVREGQHGDAFFVILEGQAKVLNKQGKIVNRLIPADFFGEISLLDGGARTATVVSETPLVMLELKRKDFLRVVQEDPTLAVKLLEYAAAMLRRLERPLSG